MHEFRKVQSSTIFLMNIDNKPASEIARSVGLCREFIYSNIYSNIDKALAFGMIAALDD